MYFMQTAIIKPEWFFLIIIKYIDIYGMSIHNNDILNLIIEIKEIVNHVKFNGIIMFER